MQDNIKSLSIVIIISFSAVVILFLSVGWILLNITKRIFKMEGFTKLLGAGDFTARIAVAGGDEVGNFEDF